VPDVSLRIGAGERLTAIVFLFEIEQHPGGETKIEDDWHAPILQNAFAAVGNAGSLASLPHSQTEKPGSATHAPTRISHIRNWFRIRYRSVFWTACGQLRKIALGSERIPNDSGRVIVLPDICCRVSCLFSPASGKETAGRAAQDL
jgi:hypothetical protein